MVTEADLLAARDTAIDCIVSLYNVQVGLLVRWTPIQRDPSNSQLLDDYAREVQHMFDALCTCTKSARTALSPELISVLLSGRISAQNVTPADTGGLTRSTTHEAVIDFVRRSVETEFRLADDVATDQFDFARGVKDNVLAVKFDRDALVAELELECARAIGRLPDTTGGGGAKSIMRQRCGFEEQYKLDHAPYSPQTDAVKMRKAYGEKYPDDASAGAGDFANARRICKESDN